MHFPDAHQEIIGNMGIRNFKKGTRQKAHGEQQKLVNRERWNAFIYLLLGNREQIYWFEENEEWNKYPSPQGAVFSHITSHSDTLHSGRGVARQVYTNASEKYSQNVWNWGLTPCCFAYLNLDYGNITVNKKNWMFKWGEFLP